MYNKTKPIPKQRKVLLPKVPRVTEYNQRVLLAGSVFGCYAPGLNTGLNLEASAKKASLKTISESIYI